MELFGYQKEGVDFLKVRKNAMLADEPGLGKTAQAIRAAREVEAETILVICPKSPVGNWYREFRMWWPGGPTPTVINFDLFSSRDPRPEVRETFQKNWDLIIIDEAHRLKTPTTLRTKNIYGKVTPNAARVWLLTGTPTPNHNGEMYTHLRALTPSLIPAASGKPMSPTEFEDEYCNVSIHPDWGRRILGNKNTPQLRDILKPFILRRRKHAVLRELPPLRFSDFPLQNWNKKMREGADEMDVPDMPEEDLLAYLRSNEVHVSAERRLTGLIKVPGVVDVIADVWDSQPPEWRKMIVFCHHRDVMDSIQEKIKGMKIARIDGSTSKKNRDLAVQQFQEDPYTPIFLGQITACGEALTLTAASEVLFAEFSWTPSDNYQAACRAHRIGQNNGVNARFLTLPGSIDEVIGRVAARKARETAELFA